MKKVTKKFVIGKDLYEKSVRIPVALLKFRISTYGLCFKNGKILLTRCWDGWDFPGGGLEVFETMQEGLVREVWEETGITVTPGKLLTLNNGFFVMPNSGNTVNSTQIYFLCHDPKGVITDKYFDEYEKLNNKPAEWVPVKDALKLKFYNSIDSRALILSAQK